MFSSKELSTLVAGAEHDINVSDLQVCLLPSQHLSTCPFIFELSSSQKSFWEDSVSNSYKYSSIQAHTKYAGNYELTHPTIVAFWLVVEGLSEEQKRSLLKFVTSCSKPPLLGFKVFFMIIEKYFNVSRPHY